MKAVVFTLGCKVNECESDSLMKGLSERGYEVSDKLEYADIYIVNTCAVTHEAEKKSRQTASRIKKLNPHAKIIFTGCAAQKNPEAFLLKSEGTLVTGVFGKNKILEHLDECGIDITPQDRVYEELSPVKTLRARAFIKVQDGCDNFCSYCIIPYLRGRSRSRSPESVVKEIVELSPAEAVINGINLTSYNYEGITLTGLIDALSAVDCRIRLGSLEVNVIDDEFLSATKRLKNFAPHFHLSLQAGSDETLKKMNRKYTVAEFEEKVALIKKYYPDAGITTDIIAGFPTETEENFAETLALADRVGFTDIHAFAFSPRSGTVAYKMKDLPPEVKKARTEKLLAKKAEAKAAFAARSVGKTYDFLAEEVKDGKTLGYSGNYLRLYLDGEVPLGKIVKVAVEKPFKDGALASVKK